MWECHRQKHEQCAECGGHGHDGLLPVGGGNDGCDVADAPGIARVLQEHAKELNVRESGVEVVGQHGDAHGLGPGVDHGECLRENVGVDQQDGVVGGRAVGAAHQGHGLGGRGALIEHRGVGGDHAGEIGHNRLEVQQRFQPALGNLRLVGRVGRVPGRALQHVALDHTGRVRAVVALADEGLVDGVFTRQRLQFGEHGLLRHGGVQLQGLRGVDGFWQGGR